MEQIGYDGFVVAFVEELADAFSFVAATLLAESFTEGEFPDVIEEGTFEVGDRFIVVGFKEGEEILEHATGCTGGWYELHNLVTIPLIGFPCIDIGLSLVVGGCEDAMSDGGGSFDFQERKSCLECIELLIELFFGNAFLG